MTWSLTAANQQSAILRILCSLLLLVPSTIIAIAFLGQGVLPGLMLTVVPGYLAWVWITDVVTVVRSLRGSVSYRARRLYNLFALLSVLSLPTYWLWKWSTDPTWTLTGW